MTDKSPALWLIEKHPVFQDGQPVELHFKDDYAGREKGTVEFGKLSRRQVVGDTIYRQVLRLS